MKYTKETLPQFYILFDNLKESYKFQKFMFKHKIFWAGNENRIMDVYNICFNFADFSRTLTYSSSIEDNTVNAEKYYENTEQLTFEQVRNLFNLLPNKVAKIRKLIS